MEYMPQCVKNFVDKIPTHMDYKGQQKAERIFQVIIVAFGIVGFAVGYVFQQFSLTVYALGAGFVLAGLLILPPWPQFRRNPLHWQKPLNPTASTANKPGGASAASTASASGKKKK